MWAKETYGEEEVTGRYGVGTKNKKESMVVNFAKRMNLVVVNTYFKKKDEHRVTYKSGGKITQVDYVMHRRRNLKKMCNCKKMVNKCVARWYANKCVARWYGGMQNGSHGAKEKGRESKAKEKMVKTEGDKLLKTV